MSGISATSSIRSGSFINYPLQAISVTYIFSAAVGAPIGIMLAVADDPDDVSCEIRASVTTGLESVAAEEVTEKLRGSDNVKHGRGFVTWNQPAKLCLNV